MQNRKEDVITGGKVEAVVLCLTEIEFIANSIDIDVLSKIIMAGEKHGRKEESLIVEKLQAIKHYISILKKAKEVEKWNL